MKRFLICLSILSLFTFTGCKSTPEKAAEKYFKNSIKSEILNTTKLDIKTIKADENQAIVKIDASLKYSREITLVKKDGQWVVK